MCTSSRTIEQEYYQICQTAPTHTLKTEIFTTHPTACLAENYRTKNRYANVLPVESTRVKLDRGDGSDVYINANHVKVGHISDFICTQAPLVRTFDDFWMMIWDKNCPLICSLNRLKEGNTVKGDRYWPEHTGETMECGEIGVTLESLHALDAFDIIIRRIKLTRAGQERRVFQLHFLGWPDFGVPSLSLPIRELVPLIAFYRAVGSKHGLNGPPVVHCSAGIGRTGTFLAIASVIQSDKFKIQIYSPEFRQNVQKLISQNSMNELDEELNSFLATFNICNLVLSLRQQRNNGTVQNLAQYGFIYAALKDEVLNPCKASVEWLTEMFREKPLNPCVRSMESTKKRKRKSSSYFSISKKQRGLSQSAPIISTRHALLVECPTSREDL